MFFIPIFTFIKELIIDCITLNHSLLYIIPHEFKTNEILLAAIKQNGNIIQYIPQEFRTNEIILEAIKQIAPAIEPSVKAISVTDYKRFWGNLTEREIAEIL